MANDTIAGTPLKFMGWRRAVHSVHLEFREGTDLKDQQQFLVDLRDKCTQLINVNCRILQNSVAEKDLFY